MNTRKRICYLALTTTFVILVATCAWAGPFSMDTGDGNGADSYVRLGQPTTNFGTSSQVVVKNSGGSSTTRKGYLRFDISSLSSQVLTDATLTLDVTLNNGGGSDPTPKPFTINVFGLNDANAGENWGETAINWNNAPANAGSNNLTGDAAFLGRFNVPALSTSTVTFSDPELASFLNQDSDGNSTVITRQPTSGSHNLIFASKEDASFSAPSLTGDATFGSMLSLTTNDGNGADSYVRKGTATTNYGTADELLAKNAGTGSTTRKSYLRFDLSPLNEEALDVSLTLDVKLNNVGGGSSSPAEQVVNVYGLADGDAGENWGETAINWNNAPANNTANNGLLGNASLLGTFIVPAMTTPERLIFSSQDLIDFVNADTNDMATLIFTRQSSSGSWNLGFASGEHALLLAPTLTIGYAVVIPEPATCVIWSLGLLGLIGWRRRRK